MKALCFGSLNYDYVYETDHFVLPKETLASKAYYRNFGGKGLNQSIALAKAGFKTYHGGLIGNDGVDFVDYLNKYGVDTTYLQKRSDVRCGHAIIELCKGQNRIILFGGANQLIDEKQVDMTLEHFAKDDLLLIQNEISSTAYLITKAKEKGMKIAFNAAPFNAEVFNYPLDKVDIFIVNEIEAAALAKCDNPDDYQQTIDKLMMAYPRQEIVMTVGDQGSYFIKDGSVIHQDIFKVDVVDTTAAGDTFSGFFLKAYLDNGDAKAALELASMASAYAVGHLGAADSIPEMKDIG